MEEYYDEQLFELAERIRRQKSKGLKIKRSKGRNDDIDSQNLLGDGVSENMDELDDEQSRLLLSDNIVKMDPHENDEEFEVNKAEEPTRRGRRRRNLRSIVKDKSTSSTLGPSSNVTTSIRTNDNIDDYDNDDEEEEEMMRFLSGMSDKPDLSFDEFQQEMNNFLDGSKKNPNFSMKRKPSMKSSHETSKSGKDVIIKDVKYENKNIINGNKTEIMKPQFEDPFINQRKQSLVHQNESEMEKYKSQYGLQLSNLIDFNKGIASRIFYLLLLIVSFC
jgi:hypothetical protein